MGLIATVAAIAAVLIATIGASGTSPSFFDRCVGGLRGEISGEKLALIENECRSREAAGASMSASQIQEQKARILSQFTHSPKRTSLTPTRVTGLIPGPAVPIGRNLTFHATGSWAGNVSGQWYLVYAGAKADPASNENTRAELLVYKEPINLASSEEDQLIGAYTPPEGGQEPLTIARVSGNVLTIGTSTGSRLLFDVSTRSFTK
jgi:hypothetical protein